MCMQRASIHVTILHRHALMNVDGIESTDENPFVITEHLFVISPDCKHDHHSVHSARKLMDGYLKEIGMKYSDKVLKNIALKRARYGLSTLYARSLLSI